MQVPPLQKRFRKATQLQYEAVFATLFPKLQSELPDFLFYHNANHIKGVIRDADYLIAKEGVPGEDRWMILTAALFHDAGFLRVYNDHENNSCLLACEWLPSFGFSAGCVDAVCCMIKATRLPQSPTDPYSEILCDADLFYVGTEAFFEAAERLFHELKGLRLVRNRQEWNKKQLSFLQAHRYFTKTANLELEPKKQALITILQSRIEAAKL